LVSEKAKNKQQDKSEAHLGMQADVSNARKQYAISGGGAAKRCHTCSGSAFCFEGAKVGGSRGQRPLWRVLAQLWAAVFLEHQEQHWSPARVTSLYLKDLIYPGYIQDKTKANVNSPGNSFNVKHNILVLKMERADR
jgi:hypothetical protein